MSDAVEPQAPAPIEPDVDAPLRNHWQARLKQNVDWYAGTPILKFPESLRVYEHLLWRAKPDVLIEVGAWHGGSTLWFRDALQRLARYGGAPDPQVIAVDIDVGLARRRIATVDPAWEDSIAFVQGDVVDPDTALGVQRLLPEGARCMVIEDSAHTIDTTAASLRGFAKFVPTDGFFVVEDGVIDIESLRLEGHPRGVLPALRSWLRTAEGSCFKVRRDLDLYGISNCPDGILQRVREEPAD